MSKKTIIAIIQAHMSSSRLPGKVMKDICGAPALYRMLERVRQSKLLDDVVIATSTLECDDEIVEKCKEWGIHTFRGSDKDVLSRYWGAAQEYPADVYVRLTSDCPLLDPGMLDEEISFFLSHSYRYVSAKGYPRGIGGEVFESALLQEDYENAVDYFEHEHVTPYMYLRQPSIGYLVHDKDTTDYRITLDTQEDYDVICAVYNALYQPGNTFTLEQIETYLASHPEVVEINAMIKQKGLKD